MSLDSSVTVNTGRAFMAALQPLTGARAGGLLSLQAEPGVQLTIPRYTYFMPVLDGSRETSYLFKVTDGPNEDLSWTVDDSGNSLVGLMSNIGGVRHNVPLATLFQPDIPIEGLIAVGSAAPTAATDFTGASDVADFCGVRDMALYETFDGPALSLDINRSPLKAFPGVMLAFQDFEPADGVSIAQNNQGAINAGDGKKFYKITYTISVITSRVQGDASRRQEGLMIADTIAALLNDKHMGDSGDCLSNPGGVQVRQMFREDGPQDIYKKFYIYTVVVSAMVVLVRIDSRTYSPWLRASMSVDTPQIPTLPDQGPFRIVDGIEIDMTPDQLELALDGTFARASAGNLWIASSDVGELQPYVSGERRFAPSPTNPMVNRVPGLYMEPAVTNDLGAAAKDLTAWTPSGGAIVFANVEDDPLGSPTADRIDFGADVDSQLDLAGLTAGIDPVVIQVYAKAPGTLFTSEMRLAAVDAAAVEHVSSPIPLGANWRLYRFEVVPTMAGALTVRLKNTDAQVRQVMVWGVHYSDGARWGAQYPGTGTKAEDSLTFTALPVLGQQANLVTPQGVLSGTWQLRYRTPDDVPPDVLGTATGSPGRTLVSVGNAGDELVTLSLVGTPATGGAALTLATRGDGVVVSLAGVEWSPGAELLFTIDATGKFTVSGTLNSDGVSTFPRYAEDVADDDFLVIGNLSDGSSSPSPGYYQTLATNV